MNLIIGLALLITPLTLTYAAANTQQLQVQKLTATPAHLTTRIQWTEFPQPKYQNQDLGNQDRSAIVRINADETGTVNKASIQESTGIKNLDNALLKAVYAAKVKPHQVNDLILPIIGYQVFNLNVAQNNESSCHYTFNSTAWQAQQHQKKTSFFYQQQPNIQITDAMLKNDDRTVSFKFNVNKKGTITNIKLRHSSGLYALDQQVLQAVKKTPIKVPRQYWVYKPHTLKDDIQFKLAECQ